MKRWGIEPKEGRSWLSAAKIQFHSAGYESENDADIVFWQVFCRLNDGAATKWLLSSVWWSLIVKLLDKGGHGSPMHSQPRVSNTAILAVLLASQSGVLWCPSGASAAIMDGKRQRSSFRELQCQRQEAGRVRMANVTVLSARRMWFVSSLGAFCVGSFVPLVFTPQCVWMLLTVLTFTSWAGSALRLG